MATHSPTSTLHKRVASRQHFTKRIRKIAHSKPTMSTAPEEDSSSVLRCTKSTTSSYRITPFALANRPFDFRGLGPGDSDLKQGGLLKIRPVRSAAAKTRTPLKRAGLSAGGLSARGVDGGSVQKSTGKAGKKGWEYGYREPTLKPKSESGRGDDGIFDMPLAARLFSPVDLGGYGGAGIEVKAELRIPQWGPTFSAGDQYNAAMGMNDEMEALNWNMGVGGDSSATGEALLRPGPIIAKRAPFIRSAAPSPMRSPTPTPTSRNRASPSSPTPKPKRRRTSTVQRSADRLFGTQAPVQSSITRSTIRSRMLARMKAVKVALEKERVTSTETAPDNSGGSIGGSKQEDISPQTAGVRMVSRAPYSSPFSKPSHDPWRAGLMTAVENGGRTVPGDTIVVHERDECMCSLCMKAQLS